MEDQVKNVLCEHSQGLAFVLDMNLRRIVMRQC